MKRIWKASGPQNYIGGDILIIADSLAEMQELFYKFTEDNIKVRIFAKAWVIEEVFMNDSKIIIINDGDY